MCTHLYTIKRYLGTESNKKQIELHHISDECAILNTLLITALGVVWILGTIKDSF